mmetsp:Transcript_14698/g.21914  ORF Transcript_14698/g.21914 Transcript_14698/m.21914 type:complete len:81 (-) Transcript_14698:687-929(-)
MALTPTVRVLHLGSFFSHGEWLHPLLYSSNNNSNKMMTLDDKSNYMQEWFAMHQEGNDTCCPKNTTSSTPGTVVIHIRDF